MSGWALLVWVAVPTVVLVGFLHIANTTAVYGSVFTWVEACVYFLWTYFEPTNEKTFFYLYRLFTFNGPCESCSGMFPGRQQRWACPLS